MRGPLVRPVDRMQRRCFVLLVLLAIALVPLAGWFGMSAASTQMAMSEREQAAYRSVSATAVDDSTTTVHSQSGFVGGPGIATVTWRWGDESRTGTTTVPPGTEKGAHVDVWVDAEGNLTAPPTSPTAAIAGGVTVGVFTWLLITVLGTVVYTLAKRRWNRMRYRQWDRDLRAFFDSTTDH